MDSTIGQRLALILKYYYKNPNSFAVSLGLHDVTIRNILNERNKPSYDIIVNILSTYDDINTDWFIFGKGEMLKSQKNVLNEPRVEYNSIKHINDKNEQLIASLQDQLKMKEEKIKDLEEKLHTCLETNTPAHKRPG